MGYTLHPVISIIQKPRTLQETRKEESICLFNDTLNTLWLYDIRDNIVKDQSDSERGNLLPPHGLLFPIGSGQVRLFNVHIQSTLVTGCASSCLGQKKGGGSMGGGGGDCLNWHKGVQAV